MNASYWDEYNPPRTGGSQQTDYDHTYEETEEIVMDLPLAPHATNVFNFSNHYVVYLY